MIGDGVLFPFCYLPGRSSPRVSCFRNETRHFNAAVLMPSFSPNPSHETPRTLKSLLQRPALQYHVTGTISTGDVRGAASVGWGPLRRKAARATYQLPFPPHNRRP